MKKRAIENGSVGSGPSLSQGAGRNPVVRGFGRTNIGLVREANEDHFLIAELSRMMRVSQTSLPQPEILFGNRRGHLFLIADGMGGHRGGELASSLTVTTIERFMLDVFRKAEDFKTALTQAHARLLNETVRHPEVTGMGTTLTMAIANNWNLYLVHAGDSRCYLFRDRKLRQLTTDHTMVAELVRRGVVKPEDAAHHRYRNVVTNVVGGSQTSVTAEVRELDLEPGDALLLCTDGLTDMLTDDQIGEILESEPDSTTACGRLVDKALEHGGRDNITAIVARFETS